MQLSVTVHNIEVSIHTCGPIITNIIHLGKIMYQSLKREIYPFAQLYSSLRPKHSGNRPLEHLNSLVSLFKDLSSVIDCSSMNTLAMVVRYMFASRNFLFVISSFTSLE